jgi:hypothetical protein
MHAARSSCQEREHGVRQNEANLAACTIAEISKHMPRKKKKVVSVLLPAHSFGVQSLKNKIGVQVCLKH